MKSTDRFIIEIEPMADTRPVEIRLRKGLKYLGRACRLRATVRELHQNPRPKSGGDSTPEASEGDTVKA
jgi:hypothetical protein